MNCQTCQTELEDLLYGELAAARSTVITEHLSGCSDCRQTQATLEREHELFAAYYEQNALEPSDEMWQAIRANIKDEVEQTASLSFDWRAKLRSFFLPLLAPSMLRQVGFAALLILLSVGLTTLYFSTRNETQQVAQVSPSPSASLAATPAPTVSPKPATPAPTVKQLAASKTAPIRKVASSKPTQLSDEELLTQQIALATREYQGAIKLLERTIAKRKTELNDSASRQFESSLALIDASIAASRQAMQAHPNDPTTARYLLAAYAIKVELMQEIAMR